MLLFAFLLIFPLVFQQYFPFLCVFVFPSSPLSFDAEVSRHIHCLLAAWANIKHTLLHMRDNCWIKAEDGGLEDILHWNPKSPLTLFISQTNSIYCSIETPSVFVNRDSSVQLQRIPLDLLTCLLFVLCDSHFWQPAAVCSHKQTHIHWCLQTGPSLHTNYLPTSYLALFLSATSHV